jgi:hypothetical protein
MSEEPLHEFRPFTSQQARDRYLAHYDAMEKSWPIESENRTVTTEHGTTFMRVSGPADAPPLVLLPGGQSTSLVWKRVIEPLSARFRTYALDSIYDEGRSVPASGRSGRATRSAAHRLNGRSLIQWKPRLTSWNFDSSTRWSRAVIF